MDFGKSEGLELAINWLHFKIPVLILGMHKHYLWIALFLLIASCGDNDGVSPTQEPEEPDPISFENCLIEESSNTLEIATWNIEQFPKVFAAEEAVKQMIEQYDLDVIAIQEMTSIAAFNGLKNSIEGWDGFITQVNNSNLMLAYLYKTSEVTVNGTPVNLYEEANTDNNDAFTAFRRPYLMQVTHTNGLTVDLINVHLKCCNGSEDRRRAASDLLKTYIDDNLEGDEVIVLGDFNDEIVDSNNVFQNFLDDTNSFRFSTLGIAQGSSSGWSFQQPGFSSQIDQILITNELFDNEMSTVVIEPEDCLPNYEATVSDHRPVVISLRAD